MAKNTKQISIDNTTFDFRPKGICSTSANNAAKTVSITDFTLFDGATVLVKFENNNNAPYPTLNINNTGAKPIIGGNLTSGGIYEFMYDGTYWNIIKSDSSKNYHVIDLTSLSQDNFYPVIFNAKHYVNDCEIHSPNVAGSSAYNQNILHFQLHACGYSDTPKSFKVLSYGTYSNLEITIGAVGYGNTTGEHCVWVRGGMKYEFICNIKPVLYVDSYSSNEQVFMSGTNYYGGTNEKVTICWSADNPRSEVLSEAATSTKLGGIKIGYTQSGQNFPVQLSSDKKAYVNVPNIGAATTSKLGAILAAGVRTTAITTTQGGTTSNRYYGVEVDSNGKAFVNVPWNTPKATTSVLGGFYASAVRPNAIEIEETNWDAESQFYGVELDSNGKAFVNVPWLKYTFGTGLESLVSSSTAYAAPISVKYDSKTLFAGDDAKDPASIDDSYAEHPLQLGKDYGWKNTGNNLSNLNNFVDYGIYNISGEHTRNDDNLPITNVGGGNTFQGRLFVYDSSLPNTGNAGNDCCITQVLTLSNRVGGDGNTYIRTGVGSTKSSLTWGQWGKHQTNVEVGVITQSKMNELIDNGIYSGALSDTYETFVLVCINNYAIAGAAGVAKCISHLLYSIDLSGNVKVRTRNRNTNEVWSEYKELGTGNNSGNTSSNNFSLRIGSNAYHSDSAALNLGSDANSPEGVLDILTMLPANTNNIGGIKAAGVRTTAISTTQGGITGNRYYGVEVDSNGKAFVNVPWTTYTASSVAYAITYKTLSSGSVTLTSLAKETITRISTSTTAALTELTGTITLSSFASKNSNKITTYGLQFKVGTSGSPKLVVPSSVKWANGIEPILTGGEIIDILFTTLDGSIYTATWTKYF